MISNTLYIWQVVYMKITFELDIKPTAMMRPRLALRGGYSHAYKAPQQVENERIIDTELQRIWCGKELFTSSCSVAIECTFAKPKTNKTSAMIQKPDVDNVAKQVLDALVRCKVLEDDAIVTALAISKQWGSVDHIRITVST